MSKITMKYEFGGKGNFLKIQVEESDIQTQYQIKEKIERFKVVKR